MPQHIFDLQISPEEYLRVYRGDARSVLATSRQGLRVKFPANILHPFLTHNGISGSFLVEVDHYNRFLGIQRLEP